MTYALACVKWKAALDEAGLDAQVYTLHSCMPASTHLLEENSANFCPPGAPRGVLNRSCLNTTQRYTRPSNSSYWIKGITSSIDEDYSGSQELPGNELD